MKSIKPLIEYQVRTHNHANTITGYESLLRCITGMVIKVINKKEIQKSIIALEDVKGLYTTLEQETVDPAQKKEFKTMLGDVEKHYQYLNTILISFKQAAKQNMKN